MRHPSCSLMLTSGRMESRSPRMRSGLQEARSAATSSVDLTIDGSWSYRRLDPPSTHMRIEARQGHKRKGRERHWWRTQDEAHTSGAVMRVGFEGNSSMVGKIVCVGGWLQVEGYHMGSTCVDWGMGARGRGHTKGGVGCGSGGTLKVGWGEEMVRVTRKAQSSDRLHRTVMSHGVG